MNQNEHEHEFYATEDHRDKPKENFKVIYTVLEEIRKQKDWKSLCDVGCASGDFLYYVRTQYGEDKKLTGIDNFDKLLCAAKERVPGVRFLKGDIWSGNELPGEKFDVVCMSGVLSLLDEFKRPFKNLIELAAPGGTVLIFNPFNSRGCHVEHNYIIDGVPGRIMIYSQQELGQWLEEQGYTYEFIPFRLSINLDRSKDNPLRSYTVALADGTNGIVNGLGIWFEQYLLKISV